LLRGVDGLGQRLSDGLTQRVGTEFAGQYRLATDLTSRYVGADVSSLMEGREREAAATMASLLLLCASEPARAKRRNRGVKNTAAVKRECERTTCASADEDSRDNCVLKCQSQSCYDEIYASNELEPGEIDRERSRKFSTCLQKEFKGRGRSKRPAATAAQEPPEPAADEPPAASDGEGAEDDATTGDGDAAESDGEVDAADVDGEAATVDGEEKKDEF